MKKFRLIALAAAFSIAVSATPFLVYGDEAVYDPESDPLISLSYIEEILIPKYDEKLEELTNKYDELLEAANTKITELENKNAELVEKLASIETATPDGALGQYEVVHVKKGAKILAKSPCEIILRSGSAIIVSITANGVNNMTNGDELMNAVDVPLYHALLVPRGNDGRGIQITSGESYVMVRGEYEIVE